jgi:hypothetical protein
MAGTGTRVHGVATVGDLENGVLIMVVALQRSTRTTLDTTKIGVLGLRDRNVAGGNERGRGETFFIRGSPAIANGGAKVWLLELGASILAEASIVLKLVPMKDLNGLRAIMAANTNLHLGIKLVELPAPPREGCRCRLRTCLAWRHVGFDSSARTLRNRSVVHYKKITECSADGKVGAPEG